MSIAMGMSYNTNSQCWFKQWTPCQIRKIVGCACAENAGNVFSTTAGYRSRHACVRDARAVMHIGIANPRFPLKSAAGGNVPGMRKPEFYVSAKRPMEWLGTGIGLSIDHQQYWQFRIDVTYSTYWCRDKMASIFQRTFSNAFSWTKMHEFLLRFHSSLFLMVQLRIF